MGKQNSMMWARGALWLGLVACGSEAGAPDAAITTDGRPGDAPADATTCPPVVPVAQNLLGQLTGRTLSPQSIAVDGGRLFFTAMEGSAGRIVSCPTTGCGANPSSLGQPRLDGKNIALAAAAGKLYWTENTRTAAPTSSTLGNVLKVANTDGTQEVTLLNMDPTATLFAMISPSLGVDGNTVYANIEQADLNSVGPAAGIRPAGTSTLLPAVPGSPHPFAFVSMIDAEASRVLFWGDSSQATTGLVDQRIHILDSTSGFEVGTSPLIDLLTHTAMSDTHLIFGGINPPSDAVVFGCVLPSCLEVIDVEARLGTLSRATAIAAGRLYYTVSVDVGCGLPVTGALASCTLADVFADTCDPTMHAIGDEWQLVNNLVVDGDTAYATTLLNNELLKASL